MRIQLVEIYPMGWAVRAERFKWSRWRPLHLPSHFTEQEKEAAVQRAADLEWAYYTKDGKDTCSSPTSVRNCCCQSRWRARRMYNKKVRERLDTQMRMAPLDVVVERSYTTESGSGICVD
jgi:hypothetical protein